MKKEITIEEILGNHNFLKCIINCFTDYDVVTTKIVTEKGKKIYGLYAPEEKKIYKSPDQDEIEKKCTIIHEVLHFYERMHSVKLGEKKVKKLEKEIYTKLYGDKK